MRFRKDLGVALAQLLQYLAEFHGVGPVAGVGFVKQGDMIIAADQQPQTDLSQIDAASLVLAAPGEPGRGTRSEEHTSELQSPLNISYAVFCLKKKKKQKKKPKNSHLIKQKNK